MLGFGPKKKSALFRKRIRNIIYIRFGLSKFFFPDVKLKQIIYMWYNSLCLTYLCILFVYKSCYVKTIWIRHRFLSFLWQNFGPCPWPGQLFLWKKFSPFSQNWFVRNWTLLDRLRHGLQNGMFFMVLWLLTWANFVF